MGVVEAVGAEVRTIRPGQRVIAPFAFSDGTCEYCRGGLHTSCRTGGYWGGRNDGGQGEAVRCPLADGTLVALPEEVDLSDDRLAAAVATLTDVMGTGHHAALSAGVTPGSTAVVVGDGAVGLCAVLAARRLGAERIIALGHHPARLDLARDFGATDVVTERGDEAVARVREMTDGGAHHVLECVGTAGSFATAIGAARPGGVVGHVGVPAEPVGLLDVHGRNVRLIGGVAPVRGYIPDLLADVLAGSLDPSPVLDVVIGLDEVPDGYRAMDERTRHQGAGAGGLGLTHPHRRPQLLGRSCTRTESLPGVPCWPGNFSLTVYWVAVAWVLVMITEPVWPPERVAKPWSTDFPAGALTV